MTLTAGTRLGHYEIRSQLGAGGMGEVYLAFDTELDRMVAIKILPESLASDQNRLQRFIQEAKAASALNHPHILTIYEIGATENSRFIATEFIDGETLRQHMNSPLRLTEILEIAIQAASALGAAHAAGIIHRDIKPENIMVRHDGYIKVLDFGLAKLAEPQGSTTDGEAPTRAMVNTGACLRLRFSWKARRGPEIAGATERGRKAALRGSLRYRSCVCRAWRKGFSV